MDKYVGVSVEGRLVAWRAAEQAADLTELLRRSLKGGSAPPALAPGPARKSAGRSTKTAANDERERAVAASKASSKAEASGKAKTSVKPSRRKSA